MTWQVGNYNTCPREAGAPSLIYNSEHQSLLLQPIPIAFAAHKSASLSVSFARKRSSLWQIGAGHQLSFVIMKSTLITSLLSASIVTASLSPVPERSSHAAEDADKPFTNNDVDQLVLPSNPTNFEVEVEAEKPFYWSDVSILLSCIYSALAR